MGRNEYIHVCVCASSVHVSCKRMIFIFTFISFTCMLCHSSLEGVYHFLLEFIIFIDNFNNKEQNDHV